MTKKTDQPIPGQTIGEFTPEEIKAEQKRQIEQKKKIIAQLNEIKHPLNATIFDQGGAWTIRNTAFWIAMQKRDEDVIEFMEKYLTEKK